MADDDDWKESGNKKSKSYVVLISKYQIFYLNSAILRQKTKSAE